MVDKVEKFREKLRDARSNQVIYVCHCTLNDNIRVYGVALRRGTYDEIVDEIQSKGIGIIQMPCPLKGVTGGVSKKTIHRVYGMKGTWFYRFRHLLGALNRRRLRRASARLANEVVRDIADHRASGYVVRGIVLSNVCGACAMYKILDPRKYVEAMASLDADDPELNRDVVIRLTLDSLVEGEGTFTRALKRELGRRGIEVPFYCQDCEYEMRTGQAPVFKLDDG